ncbi:MAG: DJ-1/PfpI family protein [Planctomycetota bacterium]
MSRPVVVVPLAAGFEEIEAVTVIDVLRRADCRVITAGLDEGLARGAHGIDLAVDAALGALPVADEEIAMLVLPGGMPGATNLRDDARVQALASALVATGRKVAAICAAPMALAGVTADRAVTSFPSFEKECACAEYRRERVVVDGPVVTSRGAGTAMEFALTLVEELVGAEKAEELAAAMLVHRPEAPHRV